MLNRFRKIGGEIRDAWHKYHHNAFLLDKKMNAMDEKYSKHDVAVATLLYQKDVIEIKELLKDVVFKLKDVYSQHAVHDGFMMLVSEAFNEAEIEVPNKDTHTRYNSVGDADWDDGSMAPGNAGTEPDPDPWD